MQGTYLFKYILFSLLFTTISCNNYELNLKKSVYINTKLGKPAGGNTIKLFDITTDTKRNKVYVQSIFSSHIAVIDGQTEKIEKYIDSEITGYHLAYMSVQKSTGDIFLIDQVSKKLIKIDYTNGVKTKDEVLFSTTPTKIIVNNSFNYVFVSFASENLIRVYDASTLSKVKTLNINDGIYGPQGLKTRNGMVYVALSRDQGSNNYYQNVNGASSNSGMAIIDPSDWSIQNFSTPYKGASEVAVDATNKRYWLLSENRLRFFDESGNEESVSSNGVEYKMIHYSKYLGKLILLTRDGGDSESKAAPFGTLELRDPETLSLTKKITTGMKPSRMDIDGGLQKIFTANMAEGTVSIASYDDFNSPTLSRIEKSEIIKTSIKNFFSKNTDIKKSSSNKVNFLKEEENKIFDIKSNVNTNISNLLKNKFNTSINSSKVNTTDIGTSLEEMEVHPDGGKIYLLNRLGGHQIQMYEKSTDTVTSINVNNWPVRMKLCKDRRELYVLSHYASTIEVIDIDTNTITSTINLDSHGISQSRTHYLSDMAYDRSKGRLFISFPEQGLISQVNVDTKTVSTVINAFTPISDAEDHSNTQVGRAQLAVDEKSHKLFVYYRDLEKLEMRDPYNSLSKIKTYDLKNFGGRDFNLNENMFNGNIMFINSKGRTLFLGNNVFEIKGKSINYLGDISKIQKVIGVSGDYLLGVKIDSTNTITLYGYEIKSSSNYSKIMKDNVSSMITVPPKFKYDSVKDHLYVGYMARAKLNIYKLKEK